MLHLDLLSLFLLSCRCSTKSGDLYQFTTNCANVTD